jgi:hypothetical protein
MKTIFAMNLLATNVVKYMGHKLNILHHIHEIIYIDKRLIFENVHVSFFHLKKRSNFQIILEYIPYFTKFAQISITNFLK